MKKILIIPVFLLASLLFLSCSDKEEEFLEDTELFLGTYCTIKIWGDDDPQLLKESFAILENIEQLMDPKREGSDLYKLKQSAGISPQQVNADTFYVIQQGLKYYGLSEGFLDISIGPLVSLWNINSEDAFVPSRKLIDDALRHMGLDEVKIDKNSREVFLPRKGMALELGALAKGYASDKIAAYLRKKGIKKALINLGGNVYAFGRKSADKKWSIGIQDPFSPQKRGKSIGLVRVEDKVVISSGPYERNFIENGKRYHHILNPFSGYPVENNLESVSIISERGIDGDALSTSLFSLGVERGLTLAESIEGTDAIFITRDRNVYMTKGAAAMYKHLDDSYYVVTE